MTPDAAKAQSLPAGVKSHQQKLAVRNVLTGGPRGMLSGKGLSRFIAEHLQQAPGQSLLLLSPGLELRPDTLQLLERLAKEAKPGEAFTALSNAEPSLNPFSDANIEGIAEADITALVSLLGPGELHPVHRLPSHLLLLPQATLGLLGASEAEPLGVRDRRGDGGGR
jgi:hypothetical protein